MLGREVGDGGLGFGVDREEQASVNQNNNNNNNNNKRIRQTAIKQSDHQYKKND